VLLELEPDHIAVRPDRPDAEAARPRPAADDAACPDRPDPA
jgi:hypothetical protein